MKADGRGKATKAGKGTGRKPLPPELKAKTKNKSSQRSITHRVYSAARHRQRMAVLMRLCSN